VHFLGKVASLFLDARSIAFAVVSSIFGGNAVIATLIVSSVFGYFEHKVYETIDQYMQQYMPTFPDMFDWLMKSVWCCTSSTITTIDREDRQPSEKTQGEDSQPSEKTQEEDSQLSEKTQEEDRQPSEKTRDKTHKTRKSPTIFSTNFSTFSTNFSTNSSCSP